MNTHTIVHTTWNCKYHVVFALVRFQRFSLALNQQIQLALQSLLFVLGCGQLALRNIQFVSQLFQFFAYGQLLLSDNGQNKSDQLFTVDRFWFGHYFLLLLIIRCLIDRLLLLLHIEGVYYG